VPDVIQCDDPAAAGTAGVAARRDHTHGIVCAAPAANLSVSTPNEEGTATSFARSDHRHAITSSNNPGAANFILATNSSGYLQLVGLGIGVAAGAANRITIVDGGTIGQAAGPLITFDDTNNYLEIMGCNVGIRTQTPGGSLDVVAPDAVTAATTDVIILEHITSGTAAADFGAGLLYQLEDAGGTLRNAARLATVWQSAAAAESAEFQLWLDYNGTLYDCGVVVGPGTTVTGNQRGISAVDWQGTRAAATQVASGLQAVISGGTNNTASGSQSCVIGGGENTAGAQLATVLGGYSNTVSALYAVTVGGFSNLASGVNSLAAGHDAHATHSYSMVFSGSAGQETVSWAIDTWTARCHGGARFYSAAGVATGVQLSAGGNAWASISDRSVKENFRDIDDILSKIAVLPLYDYNLKSQAASVRHIGPVAQEFNPLFGFTEDELRINSMDISGVTLAGVKALIAENELLKKRILNLEEVA